MYHHLLKRVGVSVKSVESKYTSERSADEQVAQVGSSTTTSNGESTVSTPYFSEELKISSQLRKFTFNDLKLATRNFRPDSLLGEGGFGCVFKGWIEENGTGPVKPGTGLTVAVKTLNHDGIQGHKEWLVWLLLYSISPCFISFLYRIFSSLLSSLVFQAEINFLGDLTHPNLVKLIGFCIEEDQRLLVYEFMPRGSLENHLFRSMQLNLLFYLNLLQLCWILIFQS